ncbi:pyridoxine 5'-phosphate oxidase C-terminal domain-containing protein [Nocardia miyunensis]|nr:pyridoxine 5'-phosphate oxidase C-terminal domain-containing protein [Nocardia miyunensis]
MTSPARRRAHAVRPEEVEFWQGDPARLHKRLRYERAGGVWVRDRLWP